MLRKMNVENKKEWREKMNVESNCVGKSCGGFFLSLEKGSVCFWRRRGGGGWGLDWIRV